MEYFDFSSFAADEMSIAADLIVNLLAYAIAAVFYVLHALGCYTIAKRRQIRHPWMAWVPFCNIYLLGCISDQYQHVVKRTTTKRRVILLALYIAVEVLAVIVLILCGAILIPVIRAAMSGYTISGDVLLNQVLGTMFGLLAVYMVMLVVSIVYFVFYCMALYDLFASCNPNDKTLFLVLSILLGIQSILVFVCRKRDDGMRPPVWMTGNWKQSTPPAQIPSESSYEEPKEPWA